MGIFKLCSILKNLKRFYFRYLQKLAVNSFATHMTISTRVMELIGSFGN